MHDNYHCLSLNVQGIRSRDKRARLKEYIKHKKLQVLFLQETHFSPGISNFVKMEFNDWDVFNSYGTSASRGCSIFISKTLRYDLIECVTDMNGRYLLLDISLDNSIYCLINVYANNDKCTRNTFFENLNSIIKKKSQGLKISGGDMNDTFDPIDSIVKPLK